MCRDWASSCCLSGRQHTQYLWWHTKLREDVRAQRWGRGRSWRPDQKGRQVASSSFPTAVPWNLEPDTEPILRSFLSMFRIRARPSPILSLCTVSPTPVTFSLLITHLHL